MLLSIVLLSLLAASVSFRSTRTRLSIPSIRNHASLFMVNDDGNDNNDSLESLKLDESNLSAETKERYDNIRKVSAEADELARSVGFTIDDDDSDDDIDFDAITEKQIRETNWSGQSDLDITTTSRSNWLDMASRKGLVVTDILALLTFAGKYSSLFLSLTTTLTRSACSHHHSLSSHMYHHQALVAITTVKV